MQAQHERALAAGEERAREPLHLGKGIALRRQPDPLQQAQARSDGGQAQPRHRYMLHERVQVGAELMAPADERAGIGQTQQAAVAPEQEWPR